MHEHKKFCVRLCILGASKLLRTFVYKTETSWYRISQRTAYVLKHTHTYTHIHDFTLYSELQKRTLSRYIGLARARSRGRVRRRRRVIYCAIWLLSAALLGRCVQHIKWNEIEPDDDSESALVMLYSVHILPLEFTYTHLCMYVCNVCILYIYLRVKGFRIAYQISYHAHMSLSVVFCTHTQRDVYSVYCTAHCVRI